MLNHILAEFYVRDIRSLIDEINLFQREENLWRTAGSVSNSAGNLVLHIIGGTNHHIGATLGRTGYIRNRDEEFTKKGVPRAELVAGLEALSGMVSQTLNALTPEQMEAEFPAFFDKPGTTVSYVLIQLALHLNYHRGQVNYLRRILE